MNIQRALLEASTPLGLAGLRVVKRGRLLAMTEDGPEYEVVECWKYRPTVLAARQAAADVKWLNDRHPNAGYEFLPMEHE